LELPHVPKTVENVVPKNAPSKTETSTNQAPLFPN